INLDCPEDLTLNLPAGAISQIFTNLIMNSLIHGFDGVNNGVIDILIKDDDSQVIIDFKDNGNGVSEQQLEKLFDPFFTTKRDQGGS
ncbi:HAMP domain-containing sensor histidine kinase, partial [Streptomyces brasiliscabiei]